MCTTFPARVFPLRGENKRSEGKEGIFWFGRDGSCTPEDPGGFVFVWWSFLAGFDSGFGSFTFFGGLVDRFDDSDSDGLSHVSDSESTKWWVFGESLDAHWLNKIVSVLANRKIIFCWKLEACYSNVKMQLNLKCGSENAVQKCCLYFVVEDDTSVWIANQLFTTTFERIVTNQII